MSVILDRVVAQRERNALLQTVPGSGYYATDTDHTGRLVAPQFNGLPPISEFLISVFSEFYVTFYTTDAETALAALQAQYAIILEKYNELQELTGTERKLMRYVPRLEILDSMLEINIGWWNDILWALEEQAIGLTGLTEDEA